MTSEEGQALVVRLGKVPDTKETQRLSSEARMWADPTRPGLWCCPHKLHLNRSHLERGR